MIQMALDIQQNQEIAYVQKFNLRPDSDIWQRKEFTLSTN